MARIAGVDLPRAKQARIALTYIFGIGNPARSRFWRRRMWMLQEGPGLGEEEVNRIRQVIEDEGNVEGDLRKDVQMHIKRLTTFRAIAARVTGGDCR